MRLSQLPWLFSENDHRSCNSQKNQTELRTVCTKIQMIFAFVSLRAGTADGLPNRNPKRLFSRTSNGNSKKAVRFLLEVGRWRKAPRHQLFWNFSQKQSKCPVNSSMAGDFKFSYLLIKYRKVSENDDTRNQFASNHVWVWESDSHCLCYNVDTIKMCPATAFKKKELITTAYFSQRELGKKVYCNPI